MKIEYAENWDKDHYPIKSYHEPQLLECLKVLDLEPAKALHFATIHGRIFDIEQDTNRPRGRICREMMVEFCKIEGFRWIEITKHNISIGLEH